MTEWNGTVSRTDPRGSDKAVNWLGALVAVAICIAIAALGVLLVSPTGGLFGAIGMPGMAILAYHFAPAIVGANWRSASGLILHLTFGSILLADVVIVAGFMAWFIANGAAEMFAMHDLASALIAGSTSVVALGMLGVVIVIAGMIICGLPAAIVVLPSAIIWAVLVRYLYRHGWL
jgi:hypothetical protein